MDLPRQSDVAPGFSSLQPLWQSGSVRLDCSGGGDTERRTKSMAIPVMQKANPGGLAKCKNRKQIFGSPTWARTRDLRINRALFSGSTIQALAGLYRS